MLHLFEKVRIGLHLNVQQIPSLQHFLHTDCRVSFGIYTVFHKKTTRYLIAHNFGKC